jgi:phosphomannomutase
VSDAAAQSGRPVILTPVGEVHVVEEMMESSAAVGGEGNGGVILNEIVPGRDAALGIALVLQRLAASDESLRTLVDKLPRYAIEKRKVSGCTAAQLDAGVVALRQQHPQAYVHPVQDGVKLYLSGQLECPWVHLRASNTEPVVRIIAESTTAEEASQLAAEAEALLGSM